jgi:hypothetical protein
MLDRLIAIRRWQWLLIGLAVGALVGSVRRAVAPITPDDEFLDRYPVVLTEQATFEAALADEVQGHRRFEDIIVYPGQAVSSGTTPRLYFVTGQYWDGREQFQDGQAVARWVPACFVTRGPYTPVLSAAATRPASYPSVLAYLENLQARGKLQFRYAWWEWLTDGIALWTVGAALVVGGIWPCLVDLYAFGSLRRPREAEEKPRAAMIAAPARQPPADSDATAAAASYVGEMERDLAAADASSPTPANGGAPAQPQRVLRPLPGTGDPVPQHTTPATPKDFGAEKGDFYPTELHPRHER